MMEEYILKCEPFKDKRGIVLNISYYMPPCCRGCPIGYYDWEHDKNVVESKYIFGEPITQVILVDCIHDNSCLRRRQFEFTQGSN